MIQTSSFLNGISASFIDVAGSLNIGPRVSVSGLPMSFRAASIGGRLDLVDSEIKSHINFIDMNIKGNIFISDATLSESSDLSGSKIMSDFRIKNAHLQHSLVAQRLKIGGSLVLTDSLRSEKNLDIRDSDIQQNMQISKSELSGFLDARRVRIGGTVEIDRDIINGKMDFTDSIVGVDIALADTEFGTYVNKNDVDDGIFFIKGAHVGGSIYVGPSVNEKSGGFNLLEVNVAGNIEISDSKFDNDLLIPLAHVNQSIFIHNTIFKKEFY